MAAHELAKRTETPVCRETTSQCILCKNACSDSRMKSLHKALVMEGHPDGLTLVHVLGSQILSLSPVEEKYCLSCLQACERVSKIKRKVAHFKSRETLTGHSLSKNYKRKASSQIIFPENNMKRSRLGEESAKSQAGLPEIENLADVKIEPEYEKVTQDNFDGHTGSPRSDEIRYEVQINPDFFFKEEPENESQAELLRDISTEMCTADVKKEPELEIQTYMNEDINSRRLSAVEVKDQSECQSQVTGVNVPLTESIQRSSSDEGKRQSINKTQSQISGVNFTSKVPLLNFASTNSCEAQGMPVLENQMQNQMSVNMVPFYTLKASDSFTSEGNTAAGTHISGVNSVTRMPSVRVIGTQSMPGSQISTVNSVNRMQSVRLIGTQSVPGNQIGVSGVPSVRLIGTQSVPGNQVSGVNSGSGMPSIRLIGTQSVPGNQISGENSVSGMPSIRIMGTQSVPGNQISGVNSVSGMPSMRLIGIQSVLGNQVSGVNSVSGMPSIRLIGTQSVPGNQVSGENSFSGMPSTGIRIMGTQSVPGNQISGENSVSGMPSIRLIGTQSVPGNQISGENSVSGMPSIRLIETQSLPGKQVSGENSVSGMPSIRIMGTQSVPGNQISGENSFSGMPSIRLVGTQSVLGNQVSGENSVSGMPSIRLVGTQSVPGNQISGENSVSGMPSIRLVGTQSVPGNQVSGINLISRMPLLRIIPTSSCITERKTVPGNQMSLINSFNQMPVCQLKQATSTLPENQMQSVVSTVNSVSNKLLFRLIPTSSVNINEKTLPLNQMQHELSRVNLAGNVSGSTAGSVVADQNKLPENKIQSQISGENLFPKITLVHSKQSSSHEGKNVPTNKIQMQVLGVDCVSQRQVQQPPPSSNASSQSQLQQLPSGDNASSQKQLQQLPSGDNASSQKQLQQLPSGDNASSQKQLQQLPSGDNASSQKQLQQLPSGDNASSQKQLQQLPSGDNASSQSQLQQLPSGDNASSQKQLQQLPSGDNASSQKQLQQLPSGDNASSQGELQQLPSGDNASSQKQLQQLPSGDNASSQKQLQQLPSVDNASSQGELQQLPSGDNASSQGELQQLPSGDNASSQGELQQLPSGDNASSQAQLQQLPSGDNASSQGELQQLPSGDNASSQGELQQLPSGDNASNQKQLQQLPSGDNASSQAQLQQLPSGDNASSQGELQQLPSGDNASSQGELQQLPPSDNASSQAQLQQLPSGDNASSQGELQQLPSGDNASSQKQLQQLPPSDNAPSQKQLQQPPSGGKASSQKQLQQLPSSGNDLSQKQLQQEPSGNNAPNQKQVQQPQSCVNAYSQRQVQQPPSGVNSSSQKQVQQPPSGVKASSQKQVQQPPSGVNASSQKQVQQPPSGVNASCQEEIQQHSSDGSASLGKVKQLSSKGNCSSQKQAQQHSSGFNSVKIGLQSKDSLKKVTTVEVKNRQDSNKDNQMNRYEKLQGQCSRVNCKFVSYKNPYTIFFSPGNVLQDTFKCFSSSDQDTIKEFVHRLLHCKTFDDIISVILMKKLLRNYIEEKVLIDIDRACERLCSRDHVLGHLLKFDLASSGKMDINIFDKIIQEMQKTVPFLTRVLKAICLNPSRKPSTKFTLVMMFAMGMHVRSPNMAYIQQLNTCLIDEYGSAELLNLLSKCNFSLDNEAKEMLVQRMKKLKPGLLANIAEGNELVDSGNVSANGKNSQAAKELTACLFEDIFPVCSAIDDENDKDFILFMNAVPACLDFKGIAKLAFDTKEIKKRIEYVLLREIDGSCDTICARSYPGRKLSLFRDDLAAQDKIKTDLFETIGQEVMERNPFLYNVLKTMCTVKPSTSCTVAMIFGMGMRARCIHMSYIQQLNTVLVSQDGSLELLNMLNKLHFTLNGVAKQSLMIKKKQLKAQLLADADEREKTLCKVQLFGSLLPATSDRGTNKCDTEKINDSVQTTYNTEENMEESSTETQTKTNAFDKKSSENTIGISGDCTSTSKEIVDSNSDINSSTSQLDGDAGRSSVAVDLNRQANPEKNENLSKSHPLNPVVSIKLEERRAADNFLNARDGSVKKKKTVRDIKAIKPYYKEAKVMATAEYDAILKDYKTMLMSITSPAYKVPTRRTKNEESSHGGTHRGKTCRALILIVEQYEKLLSSIDGKMNMDTSSKHAHIDVPLNKPHDEDGGQVEQPPPAKIPVPGTSESTRKPYTCKQCTYKTYHTANLWRHTKAVHKARYQCTLCICQYSCKYNLREHMSSRHGQTRHKNDTYAKLRNRLRSQRRNHIRHRSLYRCGKCPKTFKMKKHFQDHLYFHMNIKPHKCFACKKSFQYKSKLTRHFHACIRALKYQCPHCKVFLQSRSGFRSHIKGKHGQRDFICPCGQMYSWRTSLIRHKRTCKYAESHIDLSAGSH